MNYLVHIERKIIGELKIIGYSIRLQNHDELKELMLILPHGFEILSVDNVPIYDNLQDFREDLKEFERLDIERGKLIKKT